MGKVKKKGTVKTKERTESEIIKERCNRTKDQVIIFGIIVSAVLGIATFIYKVENEIYYRNELNNTEFQSEGMKDEIIEMKNQIKEMHNTISFQNNEIFKILQQYYSIKLKDDIQEEEYKVPERLTLDIEVKDKNDNPVPSVRIGIKGYPAYFYTDIKGRQTIDIYKTYVSSGFPSLSIELRKANYDTANKDIEYIENETYFFILEVEKDE